MKKLPKSNPRKGLARKAPKFALLDQRGELRKVGSEKPASEYTVLYFYPRDDTPGCTLEARDFTRLRAEFRRAGAEIIGVSGGTADSKKRFATKHALGITLLADEDFAVAKIFGAFGQKKFMGRTFQGIRRTTYLLDRRQRIIQTFENVKASGHAEAVLEVIRSLGHEAGPAKGVNSRARASRSAAGRGKRTTKS